MLDVFRQFLEAAKTTRRRGFDIGGQEEKVWEANGKIAEENAQIMIPVA